MPYIPLPLVTLTLYNLCLYNLTLSLHVRALYTLTPRYSYPIQTFAYVPSPQPYIP